jgi:hypothetical protein
MSDGLNDINRSQRIAAAENRLLDVQLFFLAEPTKERLEKIYEFCSDLEMCPRGYWGESGGSTARRVSKHYQERFEGDVTKTKPEVQDVAVLLEGIYDKYRVGFLAELITRRTIKERKQYREKLINTIVGLRKKISFQQEKDLGKIPINPRTIENIFSSVGFEL